MTETDTDWSDKMKRWLSVVLLQGLQACMMQVLVFDSA